jgi:hypothetical protein
LRSRNVIHLKERNMPNKNEKPKAKPFGLNFLETPSEKELQEINGGAKIGGGSKFHSMDIFRSHGVTHFNT